MNKQYAILTLPAVLAGLLGPVNAHAQESGGTLPLIHVTGQAESGTTPSPEAVRETLDRTPGGVNLVIPSEKVGSKHTLRDILDLQPGVTLLDFFGGTDQPVLTIRGSGVQSHPLSRGVMLLENSMPLNDADGSFVIGMLEARDAGYVAVRRGANATHPSANTIGGELDFHNLTAMEETGAASIQYGSFGTVVGRAAIGREFDSADFHISASGSRSGGFRDHSDQDRYALRANIGIAATENFENRTWLSYTDQKFEIPGPLNLYRANHHPSTVTNDTMPMVRVTDPHRNTSQWRIANRSVWQLGDFSHDLGVYAQYTDDLFVTPTTRRDSDIKTYGVQYRLDGQWAAVLYGFSTALAQTDSNINYKPNLRNPMAPIKTLRETEYDAKARNFSLQLDGDWEFVNRWHAIGQVRWTHTTRDIEQKGGGGYDRDQSWSWFAPKAGLMWKPTEQQTYFINVSTTREAPTFDQMIQFEPPPPPPARMQVVDLQPQRVVSYEIGGRGSWGKELTWDVTLYQSQIKRELIEYSPNGVDTYSTNYDGKTRHRGIELGLGGQWGLGDLGEVSGRLSYTYNDFTFRDGVLKGNRIAGVPKNLVGAEVMYRYGPMHIGPNVRLSAGDTPTDHSNRMHYGGYAVWGLRAYYEAGQNWSFFIEGNNLTDKRYISSTSTPATATPSGAYYFPGNGRSLTAGVSVRF